MIKNLYRFLCTSTQHSFILNYKGVGELVREGEWQKGLGPLNQGESRVKFLWVILINNSYIRSKELLPNSKKKTQPYN